jgi:hypothetical protein
METAKLTLLGLALSAVLSAQQPTTAQQAGIINPAANAQALGLPTSSAPGSPAVAGGTAPSLPSNWAGVGAGYNPTGSPKATGWASFATLISKTQMIYSYTTYDVIPQKGAVPVTSARTGFATVVRTLGPQLYILAFGTAGVSQTSTATTGTFSGGGLLAYLFKNGWTAVICVRGASGGVAQNPILEGGFGRAW